MPNKVTYEWDWEEVDEYDDIIDHHFSDTLEPAQESKYTTRLVLIRTECGQHPESMFKLYAYAINNFLPDLFSEETDNVLTGYKVPKKYLTEFAKFKLCHTL